MKINLLMTDLPFIRGKSSPAFQQRVAQQLLSNNSDIFCCDNFSEGGYIAFDMLFEQAGYERLAALDSDGYGLLLLSRQQLCVQKVVEFHLPKLLHVRLGEHDGAVELLFLKILAAPQLPNRYLDFQQRRAQFKQLLSYVDSLKSEDHLVVAGDFNNGVIDSNYNYAGKPRQFYNYQIIENELKKRSILLAPLTGNSYSYSYRGCPLTLEHIGARNVTIQNPAYANMGIGKHSALIATVRK